MRIGSIVEKVNNDLVPGSGMVPDEIPLGSFMTVEDIEVDGVGAWLAFEETDGSWFYWAANYREVSFPDGLLEQIAEALVLETL